MELQQYISAIKAKLTASSIISSVEIVDERTLFNRGYFRASLTLYNNDFLEIVESFTIQNERYITLDYRYVSAPSDVRPPIFDMNPPTNPGKGAGLVAFGYN